MQEINLIYKAKLHNIIECISKIFNCNWLKQFQQVYKKLSMKDSIIQIYKSCPRKTQTLKIFHIELLNRSLKYFAFYYWMTIALLWLKLILTSKSKNAIWNVPKIGNLHTKFFSLLRRTLRARFCFILYYTMANIILKQKLHY